MGWPVSAAPRLMTGVGRVRRPGPGSCPQACAARLWRWPLMRSSQQAGGVRRVGTEMPTRTAFPFRKMDVQLCCVWNDVAVSAVVEIVLVSRGDVRVHVPATWYLPLLAIVLLGMHMPR